MLVNVAKQVVTRTDEKGEKKSIPYFSVVCGNSKVSVSIVEFKNEAGKDPAYEGKLAVLSAFVGLPVNLFKRRGTYTDRETLEEKRFTNFFVRCGDDLIPIEVVYNSNGQEEDPKYGINRRVLSAFADVLPDRVNVPKQAEPIPTEVVPSEPMQPKLEPCDDKQISPFN